MSVLCPAVPVGLIQPDRPRERFFRRIAPGVFQQTVRVAAAFQRERPVVAVIHHVVFCLAAGFEPGEKRVQHADAERVVA